MPELPEVQTIVNQLEQKVVGKTICSFWTDWKKNVRPSVAAFVRVVTGARIVGVRRFGKHIVMDFGEESKPRKLSLVIHLKMTGHLLVKDKKNAKSEAWRDPYNQFIHHVFKLSDGMRIEFSDMRKFGWLEVVPTDEVEQLKNIQALGVDALSSKFTQKYFDALLEKKKNLKIGTVLLDQTLIAGIGNIYRSEALFVAGILPERVSETLSNEERQKLLKSVKFVLRRAVRYRGTSEGDFRDTDGLPGGFQRKLGVYGRESKPCPTCGTMVVRKKLGQRSVFFCLKCQR